MFEFTLFNIFIIVKLFFSNHYTDLSTSKVEDIGQPFS